ncbi:MAG: GntR family transcriptional regulator [Clostridia bacterium]|jgi:DNA-binding GntR family transcriptional regulator|nr:GntR family transcriptional regulator [Clostridia bacterium]MDD4665919.1 GntR family transcriptional regulator [Clostridia bacterium]
MNERHLNTVKLDNFKPLRDVVFETIREAIIKGALKSGDRLMENQLAEEMGVSRTPVREAIRKLELEGFVIVIPRKGAYVSEMSFKDVHEVYEIRAVLESLACGLAAERAARSEIEEMERYLFEENDYLYHEDILLTVRTDIGLHELIYKATRNEKILSLISNLKEQVYRLRSTSITLPGRKKNSLLEHQGIVEAISQRDVELAQRLGQEHIEHAEQAMLELLGNK